MDFLTLNESVDLLITIPGSSSGDTVTYEVFDSSGSVLFSGSLTFVRDEIWKRASFTPTALGPITFKANDTTISQKRENFYRVIGAVVSVPAVPSGDDLTTVAAFKVNFNILSTFTDHDTLIQNLITQKSKECANYCNRKFAARALTEYYDGDGRATLLLREYPINSITSIHDDPDRAYGAETLIDSADYTMPNAGLDGMVKGDGIIFGAGVENIKVVYNGGYSTLPADLVSAAEMMVMADYLEHVASVKVSTTDEVIYKPDKLRKQAKQILNGYKKYGY